MAACHSGPFFSAPAFLSVALTASPTNTSPPLVVPSEDYSHGGGLAARLFSEGRRTEDAQQSRKKKTMKTNQKIKSGAREQIRTVEQQSKTPAAPPALPTETAAAVEKKDNRLPIDSARRQSNRSLPTEKVLHLLQTSAPDLYRVAEVVGKWVWVQFQDQPAAEIRQQLAQLGFHWNRARQAWQHPCGQFSLSSVADPRTKYQSYHPADVRAA